MKVVIFRSKRIKRISRRGENNLLPLDTMCVLQYIACSICSYQCDKYTHLDMWIRAGVLVVEKDQRTCYNYKKTQCITEQVDWLGV